MRGQSLSTTTAAGAASVTGAGISGTGMLPATNWASSERCRPCVIARSDPGEVSTCILINTLIWLLDFFLNIGLCDFLLKNQNMCDIVKDNRRSPNSDLVLQYFVLAQNDINVNEF